MIDLHSHILSRLDDGPRTLLESIDIARSAVAAGTTVIAATPHVRDDYPTGPTEMEVGVARLQDALDDREIPLRVLKGAELAIEMLLRLDRATLRRFGLGGNPGVLLVELPYAGWPLGLQHEVERLRSEGIVPVLAHPERSPEVIADPEKLRPLVEAGALAQLTAASLEGSMGSKAERTARTLLDRELVHLVASDAHGPTVRQAGLAGAVAAIGDRALAHWLTEDVPAALVEGARIPPRPARRRRRWRALRSTAS